MPPLYKMPELFLKRVAGIRCVFSIGLLLSTSLNALAAPPPGHPTPDAALQIMRSGTDPAQARRHYGVVLDSIDANEFTYIEVDEGGTSFWIATTKMKIARGDLVQFDDGVTMQDFYSKLLKRTFSSVMFVGAVSTSIAGK
ncbi:hypothetical protein AZKH_2234 [Azoarcus sp. KH32C]|nr:hypothetical protein AZKH_2234 [Azoarcus sp. KH32C]